MMRLNSMMWHVALLLAAGMALVGCGRTDDASTVGWPTNRWATTDWPRVAQEHSDALAAIRTKAQAPFDRNGDGDVDRELWSGFHKLEVQKRYAQRDALWKQVLSRWDVNRDGQVTRDEAREVLEEFRRIKRLPTNSDERKLQMHIAYLRYFDGNRDGVLEDAERAVGWAFESVAGLQAGGTNVIRVGVVWE